jgi:integrase
MGLWRRGDIWYCDIANADGKRMRKSTGTADRRLAEEFHDKLKFETWRTVRLGEPPVKTFNEACQRWLNEKTHKRSIDTDKSKIDFWLTIFGEKNISTITVAKVYNAVSNMMNRRHEENWKAHKRECDRRRITCEAFVPQPVTLATKSSHLAFMRALLRIAANEWGWLERAPVIKCPKLSNKRVRWLTKDQAKRLINELPEYLSSVTIFALATGLRRSNINDLEWSQIDLQRKVAWIHADQAKGGRAIGIALNDTALEVLKNQQGKHPKWIFTRQSVSHDRQGRRIIKVIKLRVDSNKAWRSTLQRIGIEDFRFHDLRHTWASWLVQAGVPLAILQEMGGWESVEMVQRYAHLSPEHLHEHAKKLDDFF